MKKFQMPFVFRTLWTMATVALLGASAIAVQAQDWRNKPVRIVVASPATALPLIKAGKVKAFAVNFPTCITALPAVPTFSELGYSTRNEVGWMGLWSTADLTPAIQSKVRGLTLQYLQQAKVRQRIEAMGMEAGLPLAPDQLSKDLRAGYERQGELLRFIQYKPE